MDFIYAEELKTKFSVYGHFYDLEIGGKTFSCRSVLEIVSKSVRGLSNSKPCAVVVMMNPGSSKPLNTDYVPKKFSTKQVMVSSWKKEIIPTRPDNAQYQIMRLMLLKNWKHVRILNLSDLCNGNSGAFAVEFKEAMELDQSNPHSLAHKRRHQELISSCSDSHVIIAAWGSNEVLRESAKLVLGIIEDIQGLPLETPWYRYPSPYRKDQKIAWLESMNDELEHNKSIK